MIKENPFPILYFIVVLTIFTAALFSNVYFAWFKSSNYQTRFVDAY